jgi:pSer/pThr/pTyr-binding forkhead associated (FHA) protein
VFTRYRENNAQEVNFLSRRHALIYLKNDELYIEDLGSTNGTFVSGERLDERARVLSNGDTLAIGGDFFAYEVSLHKELKQQAKATVLASTATAAQPQATATAAQPQATATAAQPQATATAAQPQGAASDGSKTTFISTATSFLDIFYLMDDAEAKEKANHAEERAKKSGGGGKAGDTKSTAKPGAVGFFGRVGTFLSEFRQAFGGGSGGGKKRWVWWTVGIVGLLILGAIGMVYLNEGERRIKKMLVEENYLEAMNYADRYLQQNPDDEGVADLATEALIKALLPDWLIRLEAKEFSGAQSLIDETRGLSQFNRDGLEMLDALAWIVELEGFMWKRGGSDAPIIIFRHEDQMKALIKWWDSDRPGHSHLLTRLLRYQSSFEEVRARVFSHLRRLRSDQSLYLRAIENLKTKIETSLAAKKVKQLNLTFEEFARRYPKIEGIQQLQNDLKNYLKLESQIEAGNLDETLSLQKQLEFQTPPFRDYAANLLETVLPEQHVLGQYQNATQAWRSDNPQQAIEILRDLRGGDWDKAINKKLDHYTQVTQEYEALQRARNATDYGERLLSFYSLLDKTEDARYQQAVEADFLVHKGAMQQRAKDSLRLAEKHWSAYQKNGRIDGLARVDSSISSTYRKQTQQLSNAYKHVTLGSQVYELLKMDTPKPWGRLVNEIQTEVKRQRQWLNDLSLVLEPSLLREKLDLLPDPEESPP